MIPAKNRENRGCGGGAIAVMTLKARPSGARTSSRLAVRQKSTIAEIARRAAPASSGDASPVSTKLSSDSVKNAS